MSVCPPKNTTSLKVFFGGQTVTFGNFISDMGTVLVVVLTGLSAQDWNDSQVRKVARINPMATMRIQKTLAHFLVAAM